MSQKRILITGGTGSWGRTLVGQLLATPKESIEEIVIYSRGEAAQVDMLRGVPSFNRSRMKFIIGDVRDYQAMKQACRGVDEIYHLAALKHVPVCERLPEEAIKTNITGTRNIIRAAIDCGVKRVIDVSSDKAVEPFNVYGMTKAVGERLMIQANDLTNDTDFVCVRGGNVLGTAGSVVPLFIRQIAETNEVTLTDERMTRYFITLGEAINLLLKAGASALAGEILVMKMPTYRITHIAEAIIARFGNSQTKVRSIGMRPGEKLDEVLVSKTEAPLTYNCGEEFYAILPNTNVRSRHDLLGKIENIGLEEYSSATFIEKSSIEAATDLLERSGVFK